MTSERIRLLENVGFEWGIKKKPGLLVSQLALENLSRCSPPIRDANEQGG
jgi:hypothetical protein